MLNVINNTWKSVEMSVVKYLWGEPEQKVYFLGSKKVSENLNEEKFKELHEIFYGSQDRIIDNYVFTDYLKDKDHVFEKLDTFDYLSGNTRFLTIKHLPNVVFNSLTVKIYNPDKKAFNQIFDSILLDIGGSWVDRIYNSEYIDVYNKLLKNESKIVNHVDDYTYFSLPFFHTKSFVYTFLHHEIKLRFQFKPSFHSSKLEIYANKYNDYDNLIDKSIYNMIYSSQFNGVKTFKSGNCDNIMLYFNHPVCFMFLKGDFSKVVKYVLKFDENNILEYTPSELKNINKSLGYDFEYPVFIFSNKYFCKSDTTLNFSNMTHSSLDIHYSENLQEHNIEVYSMFVQLMHYSKGMAGTMFGK